MAELDTGAAPGDRRAATRSHAAANTVLAVLAALTAIASAVAHHYTVVVRPEVCPSVSTVQTESSQRPGGTDWATMRVGTPFPR